MDTRPAAKLVDSVGKPCPVPVIDLARAIQDVAVGGDVIVRADDPAAKVDIPVWCRMRGHELVTVTEEDGVHAFRVRRSKK